MKFRSTFRFANIIVMIVLVAVCGQASATDRQQSNLTISNLRFVGDYQGVTFDNIVEIWFTTTLVWPAGSNCTSGFRVMIDAKNKHLVSAVMLAHSTGRKININVDDTLPIRDGACEVTFLDVPAQ